MHWTIDIPRKYDLLLLDPPWPYAKITTGRPSNMSVADHYDLMTTEEIYAMPVRQWAEERAAVFLWATSPRLNYAFKALEAWGLHYKGVAFVWVKTRGDGAISGAKGPRPSTVKPNAEYVLAAGTKKTGRPLPLDNYTIRNIILSPRRLHSQKPDDIQESLELMYPTASKAELFARRHRQGWDCYGNEMNGPPHL